MYHKFFLRSVNHANFYQLCTNWNKHESLPNRLTILSPWKHSQPTVTALTDDSCDSTALPNWVVGYAVLHIDL